MGELKGMIRKIFRETIVFSFIRCFENECEGGVDVTLAYSVVCSLR